MLEALITSDLSRYLFSSLSIYTIYALLYERLIMLPFLNNKTGQMEYQEYAGTIVFFQHLFAWICIEVYAYFKLFRTQVKSEIKKIPWKKSCLLGVLKFLAIILFAEGLYTTNFRFAFTVRSGTFAAGSILGVLYPIIGGSLIKKPKYIDILLGLSVLGGTILFWIYDPQICFYVPIQPRVIGSVMMILSVLIEAVLPIIQAQYNRNFNFSSLKIQRDVSAWVLVCSYVYMVFSGEFSYAVEYVYKHLEYFIEVAILGFLYFLTQLILSKSVKSLQSNASTWLVSASMVLVVQISFSFSVNDYHQYQIIGMVLAWFGIGVAMIGWVQRQEEKEKNYQKSSIAYEEIQQLQNEEID